MLKVEYLPIAEVTPYAGNAKMHPVYQIEQIKESIQRFGFNDPLAIWNGEIVEGHGRYIAAQELGMTEIPVIRLDGLTDEERRAYALVHNKLTMNSDFDIELLDAELSNIDDIDMSGFGFDIEEEQQQKVEEDEFDEDAPVEARAKRGDIYQLGRHRLMCGDCTSAESIDELLDGEFMRMVVTSPPYGVGKDYEEKGIDSWRKTISGAIDAIKGKALIICWNIGDLYSTGTQFTEPTGAYSIQIMDDAGYGMLYNRIWKKQCANFGRNPYYTVTTKPAQDYEYLYAFAEKNADRHLDSLKRYLFGEAKKANITDEIVKQNGGPSFMCGHWFTNHQFALIDEKNYLLIQNYCIKNGIAAFERDYEEIKQEYKKNTIFSKALTDEDFSSWGMYGVWEFNTVHQRLGGHAAAYPVELPTRYIKMHSYENDCVLDPFGGTGTTMIACEQLNRKCYMMELDPHYVDVIIDRWEKFTGQKAVRLNG